MFNICIRLLFISLTLSVFTTTHCLYYAAQRLIKPALIRALYKQHPHWHYQNNLLSSTHARQQLCYQDLRSFFFKAPTPAHVITKSMYTNFERTDHASTIVLTYASHVQNDVTLTQEAQQTALQACDNFKQLSTDLKQAIRSDTRAHYTQRFQDVFLTLPPSLQMHYANIIRHLLENDLPYKRETCDKKCPLITFYNHTSHTNYNQNQDQQPDVLVTVIKVEEICQRSATEKQISDSYIHNIIEQKYAIAQELRQQHLAIAHERMLLLTSTPGNSEHETLANLLKVTDATPASILGISQDATAEQAKLAYFKKRLMCEKHPEGPTITRVLAQAYKAFIESKQYKR